MTGLRLPSALANGDRLRKQGRNEVLEGQLRRRFPVVPSSPSPGVRHQEAGGVVQALSDKLREKNLVPPRVGGVLELGEYLEMGLPIPHRACRSAGLLEEHQVA